MPNRQQHSSFWLSAVADVTTQEQQTRRREADCLAQPAGVGNTVHGVATNSAPGGTTSPPQPRRRDELRALSPEVARELFP
eukprot:6143630-Amphidinium_carterae.1